MSWVDTEIDVKNVQIAKCFQPSYQAKQKLPPALDFKRWLWMPPSHNHKIWMSVEVLLNDEAACFEKVMNYQLWRSCIHLPINRSCIFMQKPTVIEFFA